MEEKKLILVGNGDSGTDVSRMSRSIYFDAAFDQQHARSASGLIVRGEGGEILVSKSVLHNNIGTLFAAEAHAGLKALQLGRSKGFKDIQILENFYAHAIATEALRKGEGHYLEGAIPITIRRTGGR
ncbi:hypothetical protein Golax_022670, partial [Gossypium laxum]|nr:hypothetical protein [Gossypium laxum]